MSESKQERARPLNVTQIATSDSPDDFNQPCPWSIFRFPAKATGGLIVLSNRNLGVFTHYSGGRTRPCTGDGCEYCTPQNPARWHGYLACLSERTSSRVLCEYTAAAHDAVKDSIERRGSLRGLSLRGVRPNGRPNGRLVLSFVDVDTDRRTLAESPPLLPILCRIWHVRLAEREGESPTLPINPAHSAG